ncbi:MAG: hypothetical protein PCFJNLEI_00147 [Verrucomicrobiae bacterium]|nr:hypothetical protein [Verrucomicrobiae bacterium]
MSTFYTDAFHNTATFSDTGCVSQADWNTPDVDVLVDCIARGTGSRSNNRAFFSQKEIHQARLTGVGTPDDGDGNSLPEDFAFLTRGTDFLEMLTDLANFTQKFVASGRSDVVFGKIELRFDMCQDRHKPGTDGFHLPGEMTFESVRRGKLGTVGFGGNQIHHSFGLGKVKPAVQKGTFGEFPGFSQPSTVFQAEVQDCSRHEHPAVTVEFDVVFRGVGARRAHYGEHRVIECLAGTGDSTEVDCVGGKAGGLTVFGNENPVGNRQGLGPGNTNDGYTTFA